MEVTISLSDALARRLSSDDPQDLPRRVLEAVAAQGYRDERFTLKEVRDLLGFETRMQTEAFLQQKGALLHQTPQDLDQDLRAAQPPSDS